MTLQVMNQQFFEWEVPEEVIEEMKKRNLTEQQVIDEFFNPDDKTVEQMSDDYYEILS